MDLSFKEKSTWGLLLGILAVSYYYFPAAIHAVDGVPTSLGLVGLSVIAVVALVAVQIVYHIIIAVSSPKNVDEDERDRLIELKAERLGGFALGFLLFWIVGRIIVTTVAAEAHGPDVLMVAVWLLGAITVSEVVKLSAVIAYYRIGA